MKAVLGTSTIVFTDDSERFAIGLDEELTLHDLLRLIKFFVSVALKIEGSKPPF